MSESTDPIPPDQKRRLTVVPDPREAGELDTQAAEVNGDAQNEEFRPSSLMDPAVQTKAAPSLEPQPPFPPGGDRRFPLWVKIGVPVAAVTVALVGFKLLPRGEDTAPVNRTPGAGAPATPGTVPPNPNSSVTTAPAAEKPTVGTLDLTEIKPGEPVVVATRPNGETIRVPELRDPSNPHEFAESALALIACYYTTGDQGCLDAFSTDPRVQAQLIKNRTEIFEPIYARSDNEEVQAVFYDTPDSPTVYVPGQIPGRSINLAGGKLYFKPYAGKNVPWQDERTRQLAAPSIVYQLEFPLDEYGNIIYPVTLLLDDNPDYGKG